MGNSHVERISGNNPECLGCFLGHSGNTETRTRSRVRSTLIRVDMLPDCPRNYPGSPGIVPRLFAVVPDHFMTPPRLWIEFLFSNSVWKANLMVKCDGHSHHAASKRLLPLIAPSSCRANLQHKIAVKARFKPRLEQNSARKSLKPCTLFPLRAAWRAVTDLHVFEAGQTCTW